MRFGGYKDEAVDRHHVIPSDSYMDIIAGSAGELAMITGICGGVYQLCRGGANTAFRTKLVNSLTHTPRLAAAVTGYGLISSSVHCSLVALRGEGDNLNAFVDDSLFFGLLARRWFPNVSFAAGLLGGVLGLAASPDSGE